MRTRWRTLCAVQKLYSMFPPGLPGLALLLLRVSVALALLLSVHGQRLVVSGWIHVTAIFIAAALAVGLLTPVAAITALAFHGLIWVSAGIDSPAVAAIVALDAVALALLGPGAYSIDSYRFGRRLVVLPPK